MANQNGELNLEVLFNFDGILTVSEIVSRFVEVTGIRRSEINETLGDVLQQRLDRGVRFGNIQRSNRMYFPAQAAIQSADTEPVEQNVQTGGPADRSRRRRRGHGSSRRSRSRSRR